MIISSVVDQAEPSGLDLPARVVRLAGAIAFINGA